MCREVTAPWAPACRSNAHVGTPDDVQAKHHLLHAAGRAVHPLVAVLQNQVRDLITPAQHALQHHNRARGREVPPTTGMTCAHNVITCARCTYHNVSTVARQHGHRACDHNNTHTSGTGVASALPRQRTVHHRLEESSHRDERVAWNDAAEIICVRRA